MSWPPAGHPSKTNEPLIYVVGSDVPRQLILAAHATPVRIFGTWEGEITDQARQMLGAVDAVTLRLLDRLLSGHLADARGLVVSNDSMANLRLFYVARLLSQRGRLPFPVHLVDAPRGTGAPRLRFVTRQFERLSEFAGLVTGHQPDVESLAWASDSEQQVGTALTGLRERRRTGRCSGSTALKAYRAAAQMAPDDAVRTIDAGSTSGLEDAQRIYVTGSTHPDASLYSILESTGNVIVGEDHDAGDSSWIGQAARSSDVGSIFGELAVLHSKRPPLAARSLADERVEHLARAVESTRSAGVIALIRDMDDAPAWDLPRQRSMLRAHNIPIASRIRIPAPDARQAAHSVLHEISQPRWRDTHDD